MSTITTERRIDPAGFPHPAVFRWDGSECVVTADVDAATLQSAIDAAPTAVDPAVLERNRQTIEAAVRDHLPDLRKISASSGTLSNAQLSSAVRVLARGQARVIRLAANMLDGTD